MNRIRALRPVHLALGIPWIVAFISSFQPIRDNSFLWHITAGALQIHRGSVLTSDPFSFTRFGEPWRTQSWLADLLYSALESRFGLAFVPWMLAAVSLLVFLGVGLVTYGRSRSVAATAAVTVATAWVGAAFLSPRPVLFSYLFLTLVVVAAQDRRLYWVIPIVMWSWGAVHLSFPIGLLYLGLEAWRRGERRLLPPALVGGFLVLLTAHGIGVVSMLLGFVTNRAALGLITEWAVPDLVALRFLPVLPALLMLMVGAERGYVRSRDLIVIGPLLVFMMTASRAVFPAWLALLPLLAASMTGLWALASDGDGIPGINIVVLGFIALLPVVFASAAELDEATFPVQLADSVTSERMFHDDVVGGYLIHRFRGERHVFVDDRAELYGEDLFRDVIETRNGMPAWSPLFEGWAITQALLSTDDALVELLRQEGWQVRDSDEHFMLLEAPA